MKVIFKETTEAKKGDYYFMDSLHVPAKIDYFVDYGESIHFNNDIIGYKKEYLKFYEFVEVEYD